MKMFYKALFTTFLFPLFSIAQSNYKPGYVVTLKGDTVKGFIDYRAWRKNPKDIRFKNDVAEAKAESFSTKNARAFSITGFEYYERFVIQASQDQTDVSKLVQKADIVYVTDTVFLQTSIKGRYLTLYNYTDNIKPRFYILEAGEIQPQELVYHAFYLPAEVTSIQYDHSYRDQLENLAEKYKTDNKLLKEQIAGANYSTSELTKIVQTINGDSQKQFTPKKASGFRWFAGLDADYSTFKESGPSGIINGQSSSIFPKIKAGFDIYGDKNIQSVIARLEFAFTTDQFNTASGVNATAPGIGLNFTQYTGSFTPTLMVNVLNSQQVKVFISAGATFSFSSYSKYPATVDGQTYTKESLITLNSSWASFPLKASISFNNKIEVGIGYVFGAALVSNQTFSGEVSTYQAGVSYLFGKK